MSIREIAREFHHSRYKVREVLQGGAELADASEKIGKGEADIISV